MQIAGIVPPLVTPLLDRDRIDHEGLGKLIEHVIGGGVHGVFALGTTGEAPSLSYRLRREFIDAVCSRVAGRVPVLVGITDTAFVETLSLAEHAASAGASALVLSTPYYFPAGQTELKQYICRLLPELPLPLMLYNMPSLTKVWLECETLAELCDFEQIIGVKDSSGDLVYHKHLLELKQRRPDWSILIGPEHLLVTSMVLGGDGGVCGGANCFPSWFVELFKRASQFITDAGDTPVSALEEQPDIRKLQSQIESFQDVYQIGKYASRHIKATKCVLSLKQICSDTMAEPFNHFLPPERERVRQILKQLDA